MSSSTLRERSEPGLRERVLLEIFRRFPPTDTIFKNPEVRPETEYAQEAEFPYYRWFGRDVDMFVGKDTLDLGSGFGGRTVRFAEYGASSVTGLEISASTARTSKEFAAASKFADRVQFLTAIGEAIPAKADSFDLIVMFDVMEHVMSPQAVISECHRVLRPGGQLAMVFPPFYHPRAGSHLEGYATRMPGMHLLFPTETIKAAARTVLEEQGIEYGSYLRQIESDKLWNLNGLTVRGFKRLVRASGFTTDVLRYIGDLDHRVRDHAHRLMALRRVPVSWLTEAPAQVPFLQEVCCYRISAVLRKPGSA